MPRMILLAWLLLTTASQLEEILTVYLSAWLAQHRMTLEDLTSYFEEKMVPWIEGGGPLCVVLDQGRIVGFALFKKWDASSYYLSEMAVLPEYQQRGLGRKVVFSIFEKDPACQKIVLVTSRANTWSQAFYKALGFQASSFEHPDYSPQQFMGYEYLKNF